MKPEEKKLLEDLARTSYGKALSTYLQLELDELKNISNAKSWDDTLGRQYAVKVLTKLFAFMQEKKTTDKTKTTFT